MKIVTVEQMQAIEKSADASGLSYEMMMQIAGEGIAAWVRENLSLKKGVVGLVGSGNNGGDTLIALTSLARRGARTIAFLAKEREEDPLLTEYSEQGGQVVRLEQGNNLDIFSAALQPETIILDGILGTGLRLPLRGVLKDVMGDIQAAVNNRPGVIVVAVDCPSGMDCDTGEVSEASLRADYTLCMAAIKQGLMKYPGRDYAGTLHLIEIGIADIYEYISGNLPEMIDKVHVRQCFLARPAYGHKGTFGTCQIIAGTQAFTGAAYLAGKAAYRTGCGLVDVATLKEVQNNLAGQLVEAVWTVLPEFESAYDPDGVERLEQNLQKADSLVIGPGFGLASPTRLFIHRLVEKIPSKLPVLFDADGLKLLSQLDRWWESLPEETILTPHPGEMAVLSGLTVKEIQADRWSTAQDFARKWGLTLILKGSETVIADPDGNLFINPVSDDSLATAGSGDVLAGMIGGLLAQGISTMDACIGGVWLHAQAGLKAKSVMGTGASVTAGDILNAIPQALSSSE